MQHQNTLSWFFTGLPAFSADMSGNMAVNHNTVTVIVCDDEIFDNNDEYDHTTGYFTASASDYYRITAHGTYMTGATGGLLYLQVTDELNDLWAQSLQHAETDMTEYTLEINILRYIAAGKDVRFKAFQTTGNQCNLLGGSGYTSFNVEKVPVLR